MRTRRAIEAEGDFVVAVPDRGLLAIEVKGGRIAVADGQWLQNGRPLDRAPREQGHSFRKTLTQALKERDVHQVWTEIVTAFPDEPYFDPPTQGDLRDAVIGARDLPHLGRVLEAIAERFFRTPTGERATAPQGTRWIEVLDELWGATWIKARRLGNRSALRERELVMLDAKQTQLLDLVDGNDRVHVSGGPGSGKTLLAAELARRREEAGHHVQLLCFTRALASELRASGHDAATVRELAAYVLDAAVQAPPGERDSWSASTWDGVSAAAMQWLPEGGDPTHDFFIVDEVQDLTVDDWAFAKALAGTRPLWVFGDEGQAYWPDRLHLDAKAEGFALVRLTDGYRCPLGLARFADRYRPIRAAEAGDTDSYPEHDGLRVVVVATEAERPQAVERVVADALRDGMTPSDVAVLSLGGATKTDVGRLDEVAGFPSRRADADDAADNLIADTFLRFKGLERPLVVVTELSRGGRSYDVRMHIALTRATMECVVVATASEVEADPRLRAS